MFALTEPVDIHLSGGSDLTGQIVLAAAAVLGAILTVWEANRRLRQQLAHDRELRRDEETRGMLITVTENVIEAMKVVAAMDSKSVAVDALRESIKEIESDGEDVDPEILKEEARQLEELERLTEEAGSLTFGMFGLSASLRLRLPEDDPAVLAYQAVDEALEAWYDALRPARDEYLSKQQREAVDEKLHDAGRLYREFVGSCQRHFLP
jgi:hypothetical protein